MPMDHLLADCLSSRNSRLRGGAGSDTALTRPSKIRPGMGSTESNLD